MHKIAVTGATGFVGKYISKYLESRGYEVIGFGRKNTDGVKYWDIRTGPYESILSVDCVVHCAASVDDWAPYNESYDVNVSGTKNVLESFPNANLFIYISSASVYDAFAKQVEISESDCLNGNLLNSYSSTKLLGENEVEKSLIPRRVILRPHIIYGPGDTTITPRILGAIKFGRLPVPGNGKNRISFTHVENLAQAVRKSIQKSKEGLSIYNITDSNHTTLSHAIEKFGELNQLKFKPIYLPRTLCLIIGSFLEFIYRFFTIRKSPPLTRYIVDQMSSDHIFNISKAKFELGYTPTRNIDHDFLI